MSYTKPLFPPDTLSIRHLPGSLDRAYIQHCIHPTSYSFVIPCSYPYRRPILSSSSSMSSPQHSPDTSAFTALLDSYARWQDFEHKPAQATLSPSNVPVPTSPPLAFIMTCPYIDVQDVPDGERNCPHLHRPIPPPERSSKGPRSENRAEAALRTPSVRQLHVRVAESFRQE